MDSKPHNFDRIVQNVGEDAIIESCGYYFYLYNGWKELIKYVMELTKNDLIFLVAVQESVTKILFPRC